MQRLFKALLFYLLHVKTWVTRSTSLTQLVTISLKLLLTLGASAQDKVHSVGLNLMINSVQDNNGWSCIHAATYARHSQLIELLLGVCQPCKFYLTLSYSMEPVSMRGIHRTQHHCIPLERLLYPMPLSRANPIRIENFKLLRHSCRMELKLMPKTLLRERQYCILVHSLWQVEKSLLNWS